MRARKTIRFIAIVFAVLAAALGYGYWHAATHASLRVSLFDTSRGRHGEFLKEGTIEFFDRSGNHVVTFTGDVHYGGFNITRPEKYDCQAKMRSAPSRRDEFDAWRACFKVQSAWVAQMAPTLARANLRFGSCELRDLPLSLSYHNDGWWLWWVPLPHVGGKPYGGYSQNFRLDGSACRIAKEN